MDRRIDVHLDAKLDLMLERVVDVPPEKVWAAWTQPELIKQWFTPAPWKTIACVIDLKPGGEFSTVMLSPDGQQFPNQGCILDVVENRRLVWTDALGPGFRPVDSKTPQIGGFTGMILIEPEGTGTRYRAIALHKHEAGRQAHADMGFEVGWGIALDELVALMRSK